MSTDTSSDRDRPAIKIDRFWTDYEPDRDKPGHMRPVDWVEWSKKGDHHASQISDKVARLRGGERPVQNGETRFYEPAIEWAIIGPAYEAWKRNEAAPINGTPLAAWPGLTPQQANVLKGIHLTSVEDVAEMTEGTILKVGIPGIRDIRRNAIAYLQAKADTSKIEAVIAGDRATIERQEQQIAEMQEMLAQLTDPATHEKAEKPEKRGPDRPPKKDD